MALLRFVSFATTIGLSTVAICCVTADRLSLSQPFEDVPQQAARLVQEPETEDTVSQGPETPEPLPVRSPNGFDTERLNALLRSATLPASSGKR